MSPRITFACLALLLISVSTASAQVRTWTARSGKFSVEAELIDVANDIVTLKKKDGAVVEIALEKLSLGDLKYIDEVLKDATSLGTAPKKDTPAPETKPSEKRVAPAREPAMETAKPGSSGPESKSAQPEPSERDLKKPPEAAPKSSGPPLALKDLAHWQAAPDPANIPSPLAGMNKVHVPVPPRTRDFLVSPTPSRFAGYIEWDRKGIRVYDLPTSTLTGSFSARDGGVQIAAVSPDGEEAAILVSGKEAIGVFSLKEKVVKRSIDTRQRFFHTSFLAYAAPKRLLYHDGNAGRIYIINTGDGAELGVIRIGSGPSRRNSAISAGGNYLVLQPEYGKPIRLFDTRNGFVAGEFEKPDANTHDLAAAGFSPDGKEFAAVLGSSPGLFCCWSMADGSLITSHKLDRPLHEICASYSVYAGPTIEWFSEKNPGWLLYGSAIIDREKGGPIWRSDLLPLGTQVIRTLIDDETLLCLKTELVTSTIDVEKLPRAEVEKSAMIIAEGGSAADARLPPLSKSDHATAKQISDYSSATWTGKVEVADPMAVNPTKFATVSGSQVFIQKFLVSDRGRALLVMRDVKPFATQHPIRLTTLNLLTGTLEKSELVDFKAEFEDFSPNGEKILLRAGDKDDRVELFSAAELKPATSFKPYADMFADSDKLTSARFLGNDHLLTFGGFTFAHYWPLDNLRATAEFRCHGSKNVWPSPQGSHLFVNEGKRILVLDAKRGEYGGAIESPPDLQGQMQIEDVSFREDGAALAALLRIANRPGFFLAVWDLTSGKLLHLNNTVAGEALTWAGEKWVLIRLPEAPPAPGRPDSSFEKRFRLVDISTGRTLWKYRIDKGEAAMKMWGGKFWYATQSALTEPYTIAAATIPSEETTAAIASAPPPKALLTAGAKVSLGNKVKVAWDPLADKAIGEKLKNTLTELLKKRGVEVVEGAPLAISTELEEKETGRIAILPLGGPLALLNRSRIEIRETLLHCTVKLMDNGEEVWRSSKTFDLSQEEIAKGVPEKKNPQDHFRELQAKNLMDWLNGSAIPEQVYEGWYYKGLGESELGPTGEKLIQRVTFNK